MTNIKLTCVGAAASAQVEGILTAGAVGIPVRIECDSAWDGLTRSLVCMTARRQVILDGVEDMAQVAWEVMEEGSRLFLGLEGRNAAGDIVIPTTWASCGRIRPGAQSGHTAVPTPNEMEQLLSIAAQARDSAARAEQRAYEAEEQAAGSAAKAELAAVRAELEQNMAASAARQAKTVADRAQAGDYNGGWYTPRVEGGMLHFTPSRPDMPAVAPGDVRGPKGDVDLGLTGARAGQTVRIASVTSEGVPLTWESVASVQPEWRQLALVDLSQANGHIDLTELDGVTELIVFWRTPRNGSTTASGYNLCINGTDLCQFFVPVAAASQNLYGYSHALFNGLVWICRRSAGTIGESLVTMQNSNAMYPYTLKQDVGPADRLRLTAPAAQYMAVSGTIEIWGR